MNAATEARIRSDDRIQRAEDAIRDDARGYDPSIEYAFTDAGRSALGRLSALRMMVFLELGRGDVK